MNFLQIVVLVIAGTGIICLLLAVVGLFSDTSYTPMSYDEEIKWLTEEQGLSQKEAEVIVDLPWRL